MYLPLKVFLKDFLEPDKALALGPVHISIVTLPNAFAVQRGWSETREKNGAGRSLKFTSQSSQWPCDRPSVEMLRKKSANL